MLQGNPMQDAVSTLIRVNGNSDLTISAQGNFKTAEAAKKIVDDFQSQLTTTKNMMTQSKSQAPGMGSDPAKAQQLKKMMDGMEQVMNSVQISQSGTLMNVRLAVSSQLIKEATDLAQSSPFGMPPGLGSFPSIFGK